jgi:hypothetical protein
MEIDENMKIEDVGEENIFRSENGIVSHDLNTEEIEKNKHNFIELTSIRINFEPEEFKINTATNPKQNNENKAIKNFFINHVKNIFNKIK